VEAPGRGAGGAPHGTLVPVDVSFGDVVQVFHVGAASCGVPGNPAGVAQAADRWGSVPLADLAAPAAHLAREGVPVNAAQAYVFEILEPILVSTPESCAIFAPEGHVLREGDTFRDPALADTIDRLGAEGAEPFYRGDLAAAGAGWVGRYGGLVTAEDLAAYRAVAREPVRARYRGRTVLTNPPPSAGGILLALAMALLDARTDEPPTPVELVEVMGAVQEQRTAAFTTGLAEEGFADRFLAARLGSTTHIAALDADGLAASVTCTNGEGSGVVVPGTGIHVNNVMGEEDLNPVGPFRHPPGRRMPSMMAPTVVVTEDGEVELALGSAGSNRIRSAILQTIVGVVDHGLQAQEAVLAPRTHFEAGVVYTEPGIELEGLRAAGYEIAAFPAPNLFFGGVQVVERDLRTGALTGAGDPRRGGAAVAA
jgi:gamma-glutamyltranspeptidase / glutathione hydrolase